jgi:hypothetical protein
VLPKGFVRIPNFGFLANRRRTKLLPLSFHLLGSAPQTEQDILCWFSLKWRDEVFR